MKPTDYELTDFPKTRLATIDLGRVGLRKHYMVGLLEVDVTNARQAARKLRQSGSGVSLTAWLIKAIGDSIAKNKHAHALRLGKRKLVLFADVDIAIPIERPVGNTGVPLPLLIKATNSKSAYEIHQEIDAAASRRVEDEQDFILSKHSFPTLALKMYYTLPQWLRLLAFQYLFGNPFRAKHHSGTVLVTTVNASSRFGGWILPTRSLHNLSIALGSVTKKPWVVNDEVKIREILHMTVTFNHDVIDGVPARKFIQQLIHVIEKGQLDSEVPHSASATDEPCHPAGDQVV